MKRLGSGLGNRFLLTGNGEKSWRGDYFRRGGIKQEEIVHLVLISGKWR